MESTTPGAPGQGSLSEELKTLVAAALTESATTADLWRRVADLGPPGTADTPLTRALRNALRTELVRREAHDETELYAAVEEALDTGDLRPYWRARAIFATTSPDLAGRLFPLEPDGGDAPSLDEGVSREAFESARFVVRERVAAVEEATPTASAATALAIVEEAINRGSPELRRPLRCALAHERARRARTLRNLLRTRLALALCEGRGYGSFAELRPVYAEVPAGDRARLFRWSAAQGQP